MINDSAEGHDSACTATGKLIVEVFREPLAMPAVFIFETFSCHGKVDFFDNTLLCCVQLLG